MNDKCGAIMLGHNKVIYLGQKGHHPADIPKLNSGCESSCFLIDTTKIHRTSQLIKVGNT